MMRNYFTILTIMGSLAGCGGVEEPPTSARLGQHGDPIVGGVKAGPDELRSTVAILENGAVSCTGTLIAPRVVLTAAHCVKFFDDVSETFTSTLDPSERTVVAGALRAREEGAATYPIAEIKVTSFDGDVHPDPGNNPEQLGQADDIALLLLQSPVTEQKPTLVLPASRLQEAVVPNAPVELSGYGATDVVLSNEKEGDLYVGDSVIERRNDFEFLAGAMGTADTCLGDSGGPAYYWDNGIPHVVGITSRGAANAQAKCGDGGIWTLAPAYEAWIIQESDGAYPPEPTQTTASGGSTDPSDPEADCGCRLAPAPQPRASLWLLGLLAVGAWRRRASR